MRMVFAFLLLVAIPSSGHAQTPRIDRIEIKTVGIYEAAQLDPTAHRGVVAGTLNTVRGHKFVTLSTTIPMRKGIRFGFEYIVVGAPIAKVSLREVLIFPSPGLRNPAKAQTWERDESMSVQVIGQVALTGYGFDDDWEMVPGRWTFQLWSGNRKLAEQSFNVVMP